MARVYKTKQKDLILQALQAIPEQHVTAEELAALLRSRGDEVGLATVYRNLDKLVKEGLVIKYTLPDGMCACYQYLGTCHDGDNCHFHLLCNECGGVEHLECGEMDSLISHFMASHHFNLDRQKTVFYGVCAQCSGACVSAPTAHCPAHA